MTSPAPELTEIERLRKALSLAHDELQEIRDWALTEKSPLRPTEVASVVRVISVARAALGRRDGE